MPWAVTVRQDPDKNMQAADVVAIWNEGQMDEFVFTFRGSLADSGVKDFVAKANTALAAHKFTKDSNTKYSDILTTALNEG